MCDKQLQYSLDFVLLSGQQASHVMPLSSNEGPGDPNFLADSFAWSTRFHRCLCAEIVYWVSACAACRVCGGGDSQGGFEYLNTFFAVLSMLASVFVD